MHFTDGNLIILYAIHKNYSLKLPPHILERIEHCTRLYQVILKSKPDSHKTIILVIAESHYSELIKKELINRLINEEIIIIDSDSKKVSHTFDNLKELLKQKMNPPYVYFVGSVWLKDLFDSIVKTPQFKEYKIQFEGALDHRPVMEVEHDKSLEIPQKGKEHFKQAIKNKALDMLLNYIFPEEQK
ncbi:MAG TPA: hypothetical protein VFP49_04430 [Nitrososphaeraceae archaeon]|nr:hypothetical protein [Nitrososphaeraceae archaeon]